MFWTIHSRPPIHSATGRIYFHGITLGDNPPFHSLNRPGCRKESPGYGKKESKGSTPKGFVLASFFQSAHNTSSQVFLNIPAKYLIALRYIPPPVAATSMRLPFGIIHHSIRLTDLDTGKNLRVAGKKNTKAAPKGFVFASFFHARNHHLWIGVFQVFSECWPTLGKHCNK
ncbi:MAG: hypothetical protein PHP53_20725 [Prolixibacteraceae bacterium]|nr:hypothetical protein [Prolixibacteraceae bacterium]